MKLKQKLMLLMPFLMFSLTASSQTDIDSLQTNETHHLISTDVLRAMIKDIRIGDGNIRELEKKT